DPPPALLLLPNSLCPDWLGLAAAGTLTLRLLKTTVYHNASSTNMEGMALLGDLGTHSMDCSTCKIRFLQPWAHQGLTPKQWQGLETVLHNYVSKFILLMNKVVKDEDEHYPFVLQASIGCELHPNGTSRQFCDAAVNGEDFISFSVDEGTWVAQRGDKLALSIRDLLNQDKSAAAVAQFLLRTTCINELKSFVQYGKESLERQGEAGCHSPLTEMQPLLGWCCQRLTPGS
uniref:MHC class I-like antigen recognition-like domain-containing protein n=1 Tax=Gopherus agassizii TaxID=38772 RepID=A0A452GU85_9SAUR